MLRLVKNSHIRPRIVPLQITTTASGVTVGSGYGDIRATRTGVGQVTLTQKTPFSRNGTLILTQGTTTGGSAEFVSTSGATSSFQIKLVDNGGTVNEGVAEGFYFGWDSSDLSLCLPQEVKSVNSDPRIIFGKITGSSGAVAIGTGDFKCTRTAAGTYAVTLRRPFSQTPLYVVTGVDITASANVAKVTSKTASGCVVTMDDCATGTGVDGSFYICAIGQDGRSDAGNLRVTLENSQRKPRIVAFEVTNTAGTWSITVGGATGGTDVGTLTDVGTGEFSVLLATPYKREPAIFAMSTLQRAQVHSYSSGTIRIQTRNGGGNLADASGITHVFCIGSDDASEY